MTGSAGGGDPLTRVLADLAAESQDLDRLLADLGPADWRATTPAPGWDVAHQIAHLAWTDEVSLRACTDPAGFTAWVAELIARNDGRGDAGATSDLVDRAAQEGARADPGALLARWRRGRDELAAALNRVPADARLPWFGPPMGPASMATARLMETWAHGEDVAAALGVRRPATARLWHVARLAVRTRDFAFAVHGLPAPTEPFRVLLTAPDGALWAFGPPDAAERVTGSAWHFCLLAVRRVHRADTSLVTVGPAADTWLDLVQAFAGAPGAGREPAGRIGAPR
jgi:uncharacterized protein (TIGR03084 family)